MPEYEQGRVDAANKIVRGLHVADSITMQFGVMLAGLEAEHVKERFQEKLEKTDLKARLLKTKENLVEELEQVAVNHIVASTLTTAQMQQCHSAISCDGYRATMNYFNTLMSLLEPIIQAHVVKLSEDIGEALHDG